MARFQGLDEAQNRTERCPRVLFLLRRWLRFGLGATTGRTGSAASARTSGPAIAAIWTFDFFAVQKMVQIDLGDFCSLNESVVGEAALDRLHDLQSFVNDGRIRRTLGTTN